MGACGCSDAGHWYKLDGPDGVTYLIELLPACSYCDVGPSIRIRRIPGDCDQEWLLTELDHVQDLPVSCEADGVPETLICAGPSQEELRKIGGQCAKNVDRYDGELLAEEMWAKLPEMPRLIRQGETR